MNKKLDYHSVLTQLKETGWFGPFQIRLNSVNDKVKSVSVLEEGLVFNDRAAQVSKMFPQYNVTTSRKEIFITSKAA